MATKYDLMEEVRLQEARLKSELSALQKAAERPQELCMEAIKDDLLTKIEAAVLCVLRSTDGAKVHSPIKEALGVRILRGAGHGYDAAIVIDPVKNRTVREALRHLAAEAKCYEGLRLKLNGRLEAVRRAIRLDGTTKANVETCRAMAKWKVLD